MGGRALWLGALAAGCTCGAPPPAPAELPHFAEWEGLVDRVLAGDVDGARVVARDLTEGAAGGSADLGGALGFLQVAHADELADGLAAAALACGDCHLQAGVDLPGPGTWSHPQGARWLVGAAVAGIERAPPPSDPLAAAWTGEPEARLAAAVGGCGACHGERPPARTGIR